MGSRWARISMAVMALTACTVANPGADVVQPPLLAVIGHALLPTGYQVADFAVPLDQQVVLAPAGSQRGQAVAAGRVLTVTGFFSVSVPVTDMPSGQTEYEVQVYGSDLLPLLVAPIPLSAQSQPQDRDVSGATTIVDLALRQALQGGRSVTGWPIDQLASLPAVQSAAGQFGASLATWWTAAASSSSQQSALHAQPPSIAAAIASVLNAAPP
ncbi:MAG: hypothetical protein KGR26_03745 [Cyanobacteria bacterium REEB65]|nr:hypothetical protein [Cyanobacteria bacterium REEB65]